MVYFMADYGQEIPALSCGTINTNLDNLGAVIIFPLDDLGQGPAVFQNHTAIPNQLLAVLLFYITVQANYGSADEALGEKRIQEPEMIIFSLGPEILRSLSGEKLRDNKHLFLGSGQGIAKLKLIFFKEIEQGEALWATVTLSQ